MIAAIHNAISKKKERQQGLEETKKDEVKAPTVVIEEDEPPDEQPFPLPGQRATKRMYEGMTSQISVAILIFINFIVSAANAQMNPEPGTPATAVFVIFEYLFAILFSVELVINIYANWFFAFWKSGWNWFDFVIVIISVLSLFLSNLPGISVLRLFRAFRVFRLFKRIESLRKIIEGIIVSLPGVANAFVVLGLIMAIWSIMGVEFFGKVNDEQFGTFMKGMFTMFQCMTGDSWASGIARPLIFDAEMPFAAVYFISYMFIAAIIMTNVVVAILLEKFIGATDDAPPEAGGALPSTVPIEAIEGGQDTMDKNQPQPHWKVNHLAKLVSDQMRATQQLYSEMQAVATRLDSLVPLESLTTLEQKLNILVTRAGSGTPDAPDWSARMAQLEGRLDEVLRKNGQTTANSLPHVISDS